MFTFVWWRYRNTVALIWKRDISWIWNLSFIIEDVWRRHDWRVIAETLAGTITQTPDAHVKLMNWLLAAPLCLLYRITGQIPWYGLCLLVFQTMSWITVFYGILFCCHSRLETFAGIGMGFWLSGTVCLFPAERCYADDPAHGRYIFSVLILGYGRISG